MHEYIDRINSWFGDKAHDFIRWRWAILVAVGMLVGLSAGGLQELYVDNSNESFFLETDPMLMANRYFEELFGNEEFIYVLVEADDVFTPEILRLLRDLGQDLLDNLPFAKEVTSLTSVEYLENSGNTILIEDLIREEIPREPARLESIRSKALSKPAYVDKIVSADSRMAALLVSFYPIPPSKEGAADLRKTIVPAFREVMARPAYQGYRIHAVGVPILDYEIDEVMIEEMGKFGLLAVVVGALLLIVLLRGFIGVAGPFLVMISSVLILLGCQGYLGIPLTMISNIIPTMIMVISVSYSIHVMSFFRAHFTETGKRRESISFSLRHSGWPCLFTALTTATGFASFVLTPIKPVREMGVLISVGALLTYVMVMLVVPAMLSFGRDRKPGHASGVPVDQGAMQGFLRWLAGFVERRSLLVGMVSILVILLFCLSMTRLKVESDFLEFLGSEVSVVKDALYVMDRMGGIHSYEILIDTGEEDGVKDPEVLKALERLEAFCLHYPSASMAMSVTTMLKEIEQALEGGDPASYRIPETRERIAGDLLLYELSGGETLEDWVDYEYRHLRLSVLAMVIGTSGAEREFQEIEAYAKDVFPEGTRITVTGDMPLMVKMANYVTQGQIRSISLALVVIMIMMMSVFGSVSAGLIAMAPNIVPVIVSLGCMAISGAPLDFMTMMVSPIVIGIAVDDTIHYVNHYRQEFYRTGSYSEANRLTFRYVGRAITLTTIVLCCGFSIMGLSKVCTIKNFGIFGTIAIFTALITDYFVTPVLIMKLKPFGKPANHGD